MALSTKVGSFNIDTTKTAGQSQAVSSVGFQPKIVLFWLSGGTGTGDGVTAGTLKFGFGAATSSSERYCIAGYALDAAGTSDTAKIARNDECIAAFTNATTIEGYADFASMDADGFTLTIDDQFANAYRVNYLALGGTTLTNVKVGQCASYTATGNVATTGVGFQPDAIILFSPFATSVNTVAVYHNPAIGFSTGSSNQVVVAGMDVDGATTTDTSKYGYNAEVMAWNNSNSSCTNRFSVVSFGSDGFTLNCLEYNSNRPIFYIALKGGQYSVSDLNTRTDGNDISETIGFQPKAILFASVSNAVCTQDTPANHMSMSIGAGTSASERACASVYSEDNLADSETCYSNYNSAVYANISDDAIQGLMDIKSIDASGFTCVMDDTDPSAMWVGYLAIGDLDQSIALDTATLTSAAQVLSSVGGSVVISTDTAVLTFTAPDVSPSTSSAPISMDTAVITTTAPYLSVLLYSIDDIVLEWSSGIEITLDTATISASGIDLTEVQPIGILWEIDHEENNLSEYSSYSSGIAVSAGAALAGTNYGLSATLNGFDDIYASRIYYQSRINKTGQFGARFYFDPNGLTYTTGYVTCIFIASTSDGFLTDGFAYVYYGGGSRISLWLETSAGIANTSQYTITDAPHCIEIYVQSGNGTGFGKLYIDGDLKETLSSLDNYDEFNQALSIHTGLMYITQSRTGTSYIDEIVVRDDLAYIGQKSVDQSITLDTVLLSAVCQDISISAPAPGATTVNLKTTVLAITNQDINVIEGAVSKSMDTAVLAITNQKLSVSAPPPGLSTVLDTAILSIANPDLTIVEGAVSKTMDTAVLVFTAPDVIPAAATEGTINLDTAVLTISMTVTTIPEDTTVWHMLHGNKDDLTRIISMRQTKSAIEGDDATIEESYIAFATDTKTIGICTNGVWQWSSRWVYPHSPDWVGTAGEPLTSTSWDGDPYSTTAKTLIDLSAVFGVPAGVKSVLALASVRDSLSATNLPLYLILSPNDTNYIGVYWYAGGHINDEWDSATMIVPCNSDGDVYYQIAAGGSGTFDVYIQIWGYEF